MLLRISPSGVSDLQAAADIRLAADIHLALMCDIGPDIGGEGASMACRKRRGAIVCVQRPQGTVLSSDLRFAEAHRGGAGVEDIADRVRLRRAAVDRAAGQDFGLCSRP